MKNAYIIDAIRTPFGRYAGGLATVRADDLGAVPIQALMQRNPSVDWQKVDDVIYGIIGRATCRSACNHRQSFMWFVTGCDCDGSTGD